MIHASRIHASRSRAIERSGVEAWMPAFMIAGVCLIIVALVMMRVKAPQAANITAKAA